MFLQLLRAIQKGEFHFPISNINRSGNLPYRLPIHFFSNIWFTTSLKTRSTHTISHNKAWYRFVRRAGWVVLGILGGFSGQKKIKWNFAFTRFDTEQWWDGFPDVFLNFWAFFPSWTCYLKRLICAVPLVCLSFSIPIPNTLYGLMF